MKIAGAYVGEERRISSQEERTRYALENAEAKDSNGSITISVSKKTAIALVLAVVGLGGGGTAVLNFLPEKPPVAVITRPSEREIEEIVDRAIERNVTIAVLKANSENMKESLDELKGEVRQISRRQERGR